MCQNTEKYIDSATPRAGVSVDRREWNEVLIIHNPRRKSYMQSTLKMLQNKPFATQGPRLRLQPDCTIGAKVDCPCPANRSAAAP